MPSRAEVLELHDTLNSWKLVGKALGVDGAVAWRYANEPDYEPRRSDLRKALGLPEVTYIRQVRNKEGKFS